MLQHKFYSSKSREKVLQSTACSLDKNLTSEIHYEMPMYLIYWDCTEHTFFFDVLDIWSNIGVDDHSMRCQQLSTQLLSHMHTDECKKTKEFEMNTKHVWLMKQQIFNAADSSGVSLYCSVLTANFCSFWSLILRQNKNRKKFYSNVWCIVSG